MRIWIQRLGWAAAALVALAILGFYVARLALPEPLFPSDEAAYLIRALYPPQVVDTLNPYVATANNGVHLSVIRAVYELGAPLIVGDRLVNSAAYLGGLLLLWRASAAKAPKPEQLALLLLAIGFPYYRFAFSNLAEGLFVGVLALLCVATGRWYRSRELTHAVLAGALGAALVLVKPNGVASLAALGGVAVLDAAVSGGWRRLPVRALLAGVVFFAVGNLIQIAAQEPAEHPLAFYVSSTYGALVALKPGPHEILQGLFSLAAMTSACAVLVGAPVVIGLSDLVSRWRAARSSPDGGRFIADGRDLIFLLVVLALGATVAMAAVFAMKIASTPGETGRLWGRYFEFFAPMVWIAAAPALGRPVGRVAALAAAGAMLAGLAGLIVCLHTGIVLFPWDASALTAFFANDPVRAPLGLKTPYQALAAAAVVLAAGALALRLRAALAGLWLTLALAVLSTQLDQVWEAGLIGQRSALARDVAKIAPALPRAGEVLLLAPDANDGHLGFLGLDARPRVILGPAGDAPPEALAQAAAVVVSGADRPPGGPWTRVYQGSELSLYRPGAAP
ncbi:hypothetical protein [Phenylobacterium sp.]|uniref:hypothetical protein n=1 Tax=Phenylobacterium sp. TaxID=1871053 RepID=UPI002B6DCAB7|nr:hypothetical protein [Phenylobacterium sp.]HLZ77677.1 hypothetical protein [Phenylobacterium sp.]